MFADLANFDVSAASCSNDLDRQFILSAVSQWYLARNVVLLKVTLPETSMETQKGPYNDYSPSKMVAIWVSMLVWGSVRFRFLL